MQASTTPFEAKNHDTNRPHKGDMVVAGNLRTLLADSGELNSSKRLVADIGAVRTITALHGPMRDTYNAAKRATKVDLNATADAQHNPQPLVQSLIALQNAIFVVASASIARSTELFKHAEDKYATRSDFLDIVVPALDDDVADKAMTRARTNAAKMFERSLNVDGVGSLALVLNFKETIAAAHLVLATEATYSLQALSIRERIVLETNTKQAAIKDLAAKKREEGMSHKKKEMNEKNEKKEKKEKREGA